MDSTSILKAYVKDGVQLLLSPQGEHIPRIVWTKIYQHLKDLPKCRFEVLVNGGEDYVQFDPGSGAVYMPNGEILDLNVLSYRFENGIGRLEAKCKALLENSAPNGEIAAVVGPINTCLYGFEIAS